MGIFVILHPRSNTNPSSRYRVVDTDNWTRYVNGATTSYAYTSFNTYEEAKEARDKANQV